LRFILKSFSAVRQLNKTFLCPRGIADKDRRNGRDGYCDPERSIDSEGRDRDRQERGGWWRDRDTK
jgi:hypothetical protein